ncbi:MAG: YbaB/EbfC family nucleoid-associated protein [Gammaproteobacteria bacterium]|nr:YbaB/EbfC family nucleoid-associated protein [Gammaproteobacteria bacterium]
MNLSNLAGMFNQVPAIKQIFEDFEKDLATVEVTGEAVGGQVTVTLNGRHDAVAVHIDPALMSPEHRYMVQDFISAAINDCERKLEGVLEAKQAEFTRNNLGQFMKLMGR